MRAVRSLTLAAATALAAHTQTVAQAPVVLATRTPADSVRALRGARQAQAEFERLRFQNLPWTSGDGVGSYCDERIGRFCIWKTDTEEDWQPPPEHDAVKRGRDALIAHLDQAAAASPGDAWVAGQRVRYLAEAERFDDAGRAARECRAEGWWCLALEGYAAHLAGDYRAAEASFTAALGAMPAREKEEWNAPAPTLRDEDAHALRRMQPGERQAVLRRIWWLADPFWMDPGNDRLTEHYSRLVADRLQDRARNPEGIFWADDLREILMRWGQPSGWERVRPRMSQLGLASVTTHYHPSFEFIPTLAMARDPLALRAEQWKTDEHDAHSLYAPPGVRHLGPLPYQVAVFRRGAQAEVVAAFAMKPDSLPPSPTLEAGLALMRDPDATPIVRTARVEGTRGVLRAAAPSEATVLSLEACERTSRRAARARFGVDLRRPAEHGPALSDLLLLERGDARPPSLDYAAPLARGSTRFRAGERVAMFWEVYGVSAADSVTFSLALTRRSVGGVRRTVESLGLARGMAPVRMRWTEPAGAGDVFPRSLAITLPRLPPGDYAIELSARAASGALAATQREISIIR